MDGFLCLKAMILSGRGYMPGDFIPADTVLPSRVRALVRQKYITPRTDLSEAKSTANIKKKRTNERDIGQQTKADNAKSAKQSGITDGEKA